MRVPSVTHVLGAPVAHGLALALVLMLVAPAAARAVGSGNIRPLTPVVTHIRDINQDGKGVIITNAPYGYYRGRVLVGDTVTELDVTGGEDNTYDQIVQPRGARRFVQCGWIETATLEKGSVRPGVTTDCAAGLRPGFDRDTIGKDFNCAVSKCLGGTKSTPLTASCDGRAWYNRAPDSTEGGREQLFDYAGRMRRGETVHYRYTTLDGRAAVVLTGTYGWVYLARSCIAGHPRGGPAVLTKKLVTAESGSCAHARRAVRRRRGNIAITCTQKGPTTYHATWSLPGEPFAWEVDVTYRHKHFYVGIINNVAIHLDPRFQARVGAAIAQLARGVAGFSWSA
jgi:hypothetical protein